MPCPTSTFPPLFPKWPACGMAKALASNHLLSVRTSEDRLPSAIRSGNPPDVLVFDGLVPENPGEKYPPLANVEIDCRFHPPSMRSTTTGAPDMKRRPLPTGTAHVVLTTTYCRRSAPSR